MRLFQPARNFRAVRTFLLTRTRERFAYFAAFRLSVCFRHPPIFEALDRVEGFGSMRLFDNSNIADCQPPQVTQPPYRPLLFVGDHGALPFTFMKMHASSVALLLRKSYHCVQLTTQEYVTCIREQPSIRLSHQQYAFKLHSI